jgi:glucosamine--fructose-6-phosphate aminotransferase (isomerizing)
MTSNPYIEELLSQPTVLQQALSALDLTPLRPIQRLLAEGQIDRIVITGMGASLYGAYPAWLILTQAGLPAHLVDAAELIYFAPNLITPSTLLWVISQSGRSAELIHLLAPGALPQPKVMLALTNDLSSPLAGAAGYSLPINAPVELTVSTCTYLNTLAISQLAAQYLAGLDLQPGLDQIQQACQSGEGYLADWQSQVDLLIQSLGLPANLVILGRGPSLAAALTGALVQAEAAKYPALALNAAEFRHGPMELIRPELSVMVIAGTKQTAHLNLRLATEIAHLGAKVLWVAAIPQPQLAWVQMPAGTGLGLPLVEILPFQLLSLALAKLSGIEAGQFRFSGKITLQE